VKPWIGVDLDGTLAQYSHYQGPNHIGAPIRKMVVRVLDHLNAGQEVRIFTARAAGRDPAVIKLIEDWCQEHLGRVIPITNEKDYGMILLYDDRALQVVPNTGEIVGE